MIIFIITDSPANAHSSGYYDTKRTLEELSGDVCLLVRYNQLSEELLARVQPWAICHSGGGAIFSEYDILQHPVYRRVITEYDVAQIGFCGGHQLMALHFGSTVDHIGPVGDDEPDASNYHPGMFKEWGIYPVRLVQPDPLFDGLGPVIRVQEYHMDEVKELGPELQLLASSARCRVQAFKHRSRPIYGTQFHPERSPEAYPDGTQILKNFFCVAKAYQRLEKVRLEIHQ